MRNLSFWNIGEEEVISTICQNKCIPNISFIVIHIGPDHLIDIFPHFLLWVPFYPSDASLSFSYYSLLFWPYLHLFSILTETFDPSVSTLEPLRALIRNSLCRPHPIAAKSESLLGRPWTIYMLSKYFMYILNMKFEDYCPRCWADRHSETWDLIVPNNLCINLKQLFQW